MDEKLRRYCASHDNELKNLNLAFKMDFLLVNVGVNPSPPHQKKEKLMWNLT